jgi:hypothetical protein
VAETLFMGACVNQWTMPGGTARADAALKQRILAAQPAAAARAKEKWIREMRHNKLDLREGVRHLHLAINCAIAGRKKQGEYPHVKDSLPDTGEDCYELHRIQHDETGWRIRYSRMPGLTGDPAVEFRIRAGPDSVLGLPGPLLQTDYHGTIFRRDSAHAPPFVVGSPLPPIQADLFDCISRAARSKATSRSAVLSLRDLVFTGQKGCYRMNLVEVANDNGMVSPDPNVARLNIPTDGPLAVVGWRNLASMWNVFYVPHGKTPTDGYDLHLRPVTYGYFGVRSYLLTAGKIYVTWEDRDATMNDPSPDLCEIDRMKACAEN